MDEQNQEETLEDILRSLRIGDGVIVYHPDNYPYPCTIGFVSGITHQRLKLRPRPEIPSRLKRLSAFLSSTAYDNFLRELDIPYHQIEYIEIIKPKED